jgi:hypothetical protein
MPLSFTHALLQAEPMRIPMHFILVVVSLVCLGGLGWLIAAALGFARARAFGDSARWFAISAVCLLLNQIQWIVFAIYGMSDRSEENVLVLGEFFNLFVVLGAICAIVGFMRMVGPRE